MFANDALPAEKVFNALRALLGRGELHQVDGLLEAFLQALDSSGESLDPVLVASLRAAALSGMSAHDLLSMISIGRSGGDRFVVLAQAPVQVEALESASDASGSLSPWNGLQLAQAATPAATEAASATGASSTDSGSATTAPAPAAPATAGPGQASDAAAGNQPGQAPPGQAQAPAPGQSAQPVSAGAEIFKALTSGALPSVSAPTSAAQGQGQVEGVRPFALQAAPFSSASSTPGPSGLSADLQGMQQANQAIQQSLGSHSASRASANNSLNNTSGVQVSQAAGMTSLGSGTEVANAGLITPFVTQNVNPDGSLANKIVSVGQTTDPVLTGNASALQVGATGKVAVAQALAPEVPKAVAAPVVINQSGNVSVTTDTPSVVEGTGSGQTEIVFKITRTNPVSVESVPWSISGLTPDDVEGGLDALSGAADFAGGEFTKTVVLKVTRDWQVEQKEPLTLTIKDGKFSMVQTATASSEVLNDDKAIYRIQPLVDAVLEGDPPDSDFTVVQFKVTRDAPLQRPDLPLPADEVEWSVSSLFPADQDLHLSDYRGTVRFALGETEKVIDLRVRTDGLKELDEGLTVKLGKSTFGDNDPSKSEATTVLLNDDPYIYLQLVQQEKIEGQLLRFALTRSSPDGVISLNYEVLPLSAGTSMLPAADPQTRKRLGTVAFADGVSLAYIDVQSVDDLIVGPDQKFLVAVDGASAGVRVSNAVAEGLVLNNDALIGIDRLETLGSQNGIITYQAVIKREFALGFQGLTHTVNWRVEGAGENPARPDEFILPTNFQLDFGPSDTEKTITFHAYAGTQSAGVRTFEVRLYESDPKVQLSIEGARANIVPEGVEASVRSVATRLIEGTNIEVPQSFEIRLSGAPGSGVVVNWAASGAGAGAATADDFKQGVFPSGQVIFDGARALETLPGTAVSAEQQTVSLSLAANSTYALTVGKTTLTGRLGDDTAMSALVNLLKADAAYSIADFTLAESAGKLRLVWKGSGNALDVATLGQIAKSITLIPNPDGTVEANENYKVSIGVAGGPARVIVPEAFGTLISDESSIAFSQEAFSANEGSAVAGGELAATVVRDGYRRTTMTAKWKVELVGEASASLGDFAADQDELGTNGGLPSGTIELLPGALQKDIKIRFAGDHQLEADKKFRIVLFDAEPGTLLGAQSAATGLQVNDDSIFAMRAVTAQGIEGQGGASAMLSITVDRTGDLRSSGSVVWSTSASGSTPSAASDFTGFNNQLPSGTLFFQPGDTYQTINIPLRGDDIHEADETLTVTLGSSNPPTASSLDPNKLSTVATLANDDSLVYFVGPASVSQFEDTGAFILTLERTGATDRAISVAWEIDFAVAGNNRGSSSDFINSSGQVGGTVNFAANQTQATLTVPQAADLVLESDEAFAVTLKTPAVGDGIELGAQSTITGTLLNDDVAVFVKRIVPAASEGNSASTSRDYLVEFERHGNIDLPSKLDWTVSGSSFVLNGQPWATALDAAEITSALTGTLEWKGLLADPLESTVQTVTVSIKGDTNAEGLEAFKIALALNSADTRTDIPKPEAFGIARDDDATLEISAASASVPEGKQGATQVLAFDVVRSGDLTSTITVDVLLNSTADGVTRPAQPSPGTGVALGVADPVATRYAQVTFSPLTQSITVDYGGGNTEQITVTPASQTARINVQLAGDDRVESNGAVTLTLANPQVSPSGGDANVTIRSGAASATTSVTDEDTSFTVVAPANLAEGRVRPATTPDVKTFTYTINRGGDTSKEAVVSWSIAAVSTVANTEAVQPDDFSSYRTSDDSGATTASVNSLPRGMLTWAAGDSTSKTISLVFADDTDIEFDDAFNLDLSVLAGNAQINAASPSLILSDDFGYLVTPVNAETLEGSASTANYLSFDLTQKPVSSQVKTVNWSVQLDPPNDTASPNLVMRTDFAASLPAGISYNAGNHTLFGSLTFPANDPSPIRLQIPLVTDSTPETLLKDAVLTLKSSDGSVTYATATAVLKDDDASFTLQKVLAEQTEGSLAGQTQDFTFSIRREGYLDQTSTVKWAVVGSADITSADFASGQDTLNAWGGLPSGSFSFAAGETTKDITVRVVMDSKKENDETLTLQLYDESAGNTLKVASVSGRIDNDDAYVYFLAGTTDSTAYDLDRTEGDSGTQAYTFKLKREGYLLQSSVVNWSVGYSADSGLTAASSSDLLGTLSGTVTFASGETDKEITVYANPDSGSPGNNPVNTYFPYYIWGGSPSGTLENDEQFKVDLVAVGVGTEVTTTAAAGALRNDDVRIQVVDLITSRVEGLASQQASADIVHTIQFQRVGSTAQAVAVEWYVDNADILTQLYKVNSTLVSGMTTNGTLSFGSATPTKTSSEIKGLLSWAAGDSSVKTITLTPVADDVVESDYSFQLKLRAFTGASNGTQYIDEIGFDKASTTVYAPQFGSTDWDNYNASNQIPVGKFVIKRDESAIWITSELKPAYDNADSMVDSWQSQFIGYDYYQVGAGGVKYNRFAQDVYYTGNATTNAEGSLTGASAGSDYTAVGSTSLSFSSATTARTLSVNLTDDANFETSEGLSVFLSAASGATVLVDRARVILRDNDGTPDYVMRVSGGTAVEGVDQNLEFLADFGKPISQDSTFQVQLTLPGSADTASSFVFSADGGQTWSSSYSNNSIITVPGASAASSLLIRVPVTNDTLDESVEQVTLSVRSKTGDSFLVPFNAATVNLVDDDNPQFRSGETTARSAEQGTFYYYKVVEFNQRNANAPVANPLDEAVGASEDVRSPSWFNSPVYYDTNTATAAEGYTDGYTDKVYTATGENLSVSTLTTAAGTGQGLTLQLRFKGSWEYSLVDADLGQHRGAAGFQALTGTVDGQGYTVATLAVDTGIEQLRLRSALTQEASGPTAAMQAALPMDVTVQKVQPVLVARDVTVSEGAGSAQVEVLAVGGDNYGTVSVNAQTVDGTWVDRTFIINRDYSTAVAQSVTWAVSALTSSMMVDGDGSYEYVRGYFGTKTMDTVSSDDFVILTGQTANPSTDALFTGLPTGTVTFPVGQKEAPITLRVRADSFGEQAEDFAIVLSNAPTGSVIEPNPEAPSTYTNRRNAGFGRLENDDQLFWLDGKVYNESVDDQGAVSVTSTLDGKNYVLRSFTINREGASEAGASVDWVIKVISSAESLNHQAETADFATTATAAEGVTSWTSSGSVWTSNARTVTFLPGETSQSVTVALLDDGVVEDAEQFSIALTNPQPLSGNDGIPGISSTRGAASFLIGDNDGREVSVSVSSSPVPSSDGVDEGTSVNPDRQLLLNFSRSGATTDATQALFEMRVSSLTNGQNNYFSLDSGSSGKASVVSTSLNSPGDGSLVWRGIVNFAAGSSSAQVAFNIRDDAWVENNIPVTVTLYDHESLPGAYMYPTSVGSSGAYAPNDPVGIGTAGASSLPNWGNTVRDPDAYTDTFTIRDDDTRLWLDGFNDTWHSSSWTRPPNNDWWKVVKTWTEGDSAYATSGAVNPSYLTGGGDAGGLAASGNTDITLSFVRAGLQANAITLNWSIVHGTTDNADFNATSGSITLAGDPTSTAQVRTIPVTIANFYRADRDVENNETFQLVFSDASNSSNPIFTFDWVREGYSDGRDRAAKSALTIDAQLRTDDIQYSVALNSANPANSSTYSGAYQVIEGPNGSTTPISFDIKRFLDANNDGADGYWSSSTVAWRVVGVGTYASDVTAADFYGASSGTVTFSAGNELTGAPAELTKTITVVVKGDYKVERGERFRIELYDASTGYVINNDTVGQGIATALIINDDTGVKISDVFNREEDGTGTVTHTYTVTRLGDLSKTSTMDWGKFNVSTDDVDFSGTLTGSLTFGPSSPSPSLATFEGYGEQSRTLSVTTTRNVTPSADKYFDIQLSNFTQVEDLVDTVGRGSILNDDAVFSVKLPTGDDGKRVEGTTAYSFAVSRSHLTPQSQTVGWETVAAGGRNLVNSTDFGGALPAGSLIFSSTVAVETRAGDASTAEVQTISPGGGVVVSGSTYSLVAGSTTLSAVATDTSVSGLVTALQAASGYAGAPFTIAASGTSLVMTWKTASEVTVQARMGEMTKLISVAASQSDLVPEPNERFAIQLNVGSGAGAEGDTWDQVDAVGEIGNDDPAIYLDDSQPVVQSEGTGSRLNSSNLLTDQLSYTFGITQDSPNQALASTLTWKVTFPSGKTASAADFDPTQALEGTITLTGSETQLVTLKLAPDTDIEADETFVIELSSTNSTTSSAIVASTSEGAIANDDFTLALVSSSVTTVEGNDVFGGSTVDFVIMRTGATSAGANVTWSLTGLTGLAGAASSDDFVASSTSGSFSLQASDTTYTVKIPIKGDVIFEGSETFGIRLDYKRLTADGAAENGTGASVTGSGALTDDDAAFALGTITSVVEGNNVGGVTNKGNVFSFVINRLGVTIDSGSVRWAVSAGPSGTASLDSSDFTDGKLPSGIASFAAGESSKTIQITTLKGDTAYEGTESYTVTLSSPGPGSSVTAEGKTAVGTVEFDELAFGVTTVSSAATVTEGSDGTATPVTLQFKIERVGGNEASVVNWSLAGVNTVDITGADFVGFNGAMPSGQVTFAAGGASEQIVSIPVLADQLREATDASLRLTIGVASGQPGALVSGRTSADAILHDDDDALKISAQDLAQPEGSTGDVSYSFLVERVGSPDTETKVTWTAAGSGNDPLSVTEFASAATGELTFAAGSTTPQVITLKVKGDREGERDEGFSVTLTDSSGKTDFVTRSASQTVLNDDPALAAALNDSNLSEGQEADIGGADLRYSFTVTRSGDTTGTSSVEWTLDPASSGASVDEYDFGGIFPAGVITFAPGQTTKTIYFMNDADNVAEPDEGFVVRLSNAVNATILTPELSDIMVNDDVVVTLSASTQRGPEGNAGDAPAQFRFNLSATGTSAAQQVIVSWHVEGYGLYPSNLADFYSNYVAAPYTLAAGSGDDAGKLVLTWKEAGNASGAATLTPAGGSALTASANDGTASTVEVQKLAVATLTPNKAYTLSFGGQTITTEALDATPTLDELLMALVSGPDRIGLFAGYPSGKTVINLSNGAGQQDFLVKIAGDDGVGPDEQLRVMVDGVVASDGNGGAIGASMVDGGSTLVATVYDDDNLISLRQGDAVRVTEGDELKQTSLRFALDVLKRPANSADWQDIIVEWEVSPDSQADFADFVGSQLPSGTTTISRQQLTGVNPADPNGAYISVPVSGDFSVEKDELVTVRITKAYVQGSSGGVEVDGTGVKADGLIVADDQGLQVILNDDSQEEDGAKFTFDVLRSGITSAPLTVTWKVGVPPGLHDGEGASANDFIDPATGRPYATVTGAAGNYLTGTLQFAGGDTIKKLSLFASFDTRPEASESFRVSIDSSDPSYHGGGVYLDGVIENDDLPVPAQPQYETGFPPLGSIVIPPQITATAVAAAVAEGPAQQSGGQVGTGGLVGSGGGTASAAGGQFVLTLTRTGGDLSSPSSVNWRIAPGISDLLASDFVAGQDVLGTNYGLPSGAVSFAAGEVSKTVQIDIAGDTSIEANEPLQFQLFAPLGALITTPEVALSVTNDDSLMGLAALVGSASQIKDGADGASSPFSFKVERQGDTSGPASAQWAVTAPVTTSGGQIKATPGTFASGQDALLNNGGFPSGTVSFAPGESSKVVSFSVLGNPLPSKDEAFEIRLSNSVGAPLDPAHAMLAGTVANDDVRVFLLLSTSRAEGNGTLGGSPFLEFDTEGPANAKVTARWHVEATGGAGSVTAADFISGWDALGNNGGLPSGESVYNISDSISGGLGYFIEELQFFFAPDSAYEGNETYRFVIDSLVAEDANGAPLSVLTYASPTTQATSVTATIIDDDLRIGLRQLAGTTSAAETNVDGTGAPQTSMMRFYVDALNLPSSLALVKDITVQYRVRGESGTDGVQTLDAADADDFQGAVLPTSQKTFTVAQLTNADLNDTYIDIPVAGDLAVEGNERFVVELLSAGQGTNGTGGGVEIEPLQSSVSGVITNDDVPVVMSLFSPPASAIEGRFFDIEVELSQVPTQALTVYWQVGVPPGTAANSGVSADDFLLSAGQTLTGNVISGTIEFRAGIPNAQLILNTADDTKVELPESLRVSFQPADTSIAGIQHTVVITDNDGALGTVPTDPMLDVIDPLTP